MRVGSSLIGRSERFEYSNVGYSLLSAMIEAVTGTGYAEHVRADLIEPLGLTSTTPDLPAAGDLATGYSAVAHADVRLPLGHPPTRAMAAVTGFCSTAEDLTAWFSAHATGRRELLSDHAKHLAQQPEWAVERTERQYGLGFVVERCGSRVLVGHSGGFPGHITKSVLDPAAALAVSVLTNCLDGPAVELALGVVEILDLDAFCGRRGCGSTLIALDPTQEHPAAAPVLLEVLEANTLRVARDGGFGSYAETWPLGHLDDGTPALRADSGVTTVPPAAYTPGAPASAGPSLSPPFSPRTP